MGRSRCGMGSSVCRSLEPARSLSALWRGLPLVFGARDLSGCFLDHLFSSNPTFLILRSQKLLPLPAFTWLGVWTHLLGFCVSICFLTCSLSRSPIRLPRLALELLFRPSLLFPALPWSPLDRLPSSRSPTETEVYAACNCSLMYHSILPY